MNKLSKDYNFTDAVVFLLIIFAVLSSGYGQIQDIENTLSYSDTHFFLNRVSNMLTEIQGGRLPVFYNYDFNNFGYGSSFFYGQLTLYPFILIYALLGDMACILSYRLVAFTLTYIGVRGICKRFSIQNYRFIAILCITSLQMSTFWFHCVLIANQLGIALTTLFVAQAIDIFRDKKPCYKAVLVFTLLFGTHLVSAVLAFLYAVMLFILYFDKTRFKDYFKFAGLCVICNIYPISNILYHLQGITLYSSQVNKNIWIDPDTAFSWTCTTLVPGEFEGDRQGFTWLIVAIPCLVCLIMRIRQHNVHKREYIMLGVSALFWVIGLYPVWSYINNIWALPIQFPSRYTPFIIFAVMCICFRGITFKKPLKYALVIASIILFFTWGVCADEEDTQVNQVICTNQVMNGEYFDAETWSWDLNYLADHSNIVTDSNGNTYGVDNTDNTGIITIQGNFKAGDTLIFPKIWYKGYVSNAGEVTKGRSQLCVVTVDKDTTTVTLYYRHSLILWVLMFVSGVSLVYVGIKIKGGKKANEKN